MSRPHGKLAALVVLLLAFGNCDDEDPPKPADGGVDRPRDGQVADTASSDGPARDGPAADTRPDTPVDSPSDAPVADTRSPADMADVPPSCGLPGLPCCGKDNTCLNGGCCAQFTGGIQTCVAAGSACYSNTSRDGGPTGGGLCMGGLCSGCGDFLNQVCCQRNICTGANLLCDTGDNLCKECGTTGNPCCIYRATDPGEADGRECKGMNVCVGPEDTLGTCAPCGGTGQPCCKGRGCANGGCCVGEEEDEQTCVAANATCGGGNGTCMAGKCSACGNPAQQCCPGEICYDSNHFCDDDDEECEPCGAAGQPACPGNVCLVAGLCHNGAGGCINTGAVCGTDAAKTCNADGTCGPAGMICGGLNQPCCGTGMDLFCTKSGTTCLRPAAGSAEMPKCIACGNLEDPCCGPDNTCRAGECETEQAIPRCED